MWPSNERPFYGTFIASQARSLAANGIAVDVAEIPGYASSLSYLSAGAAAARRAWADDYDLVHMHSGHTAFTTAVAVPRPRLISFVGGDLLGNPTERGVNPKSRIEASVFRYLAHLADATITKSAEMEEALPMAVRDRNHVLPNGVDMDFFAPRGRQTARDRLGWDSPGPVALFVGDPTDPRKNFELARRAVELASHKVQGLRLETAWGVPPTRVADAMSAADCLVFPSRSEGSPNVVKEAMAAELPIISTAVGDVRDRLEGIKGCFVVESTAEAFAAAIPRAVERRAPQARAAVAALGLDLVAERLIEIYSQLL
jgi:glycosyltransferase involved in cell wall biosynthesis